MIPSRILRILYLFTVMSTSHIYAMYGQEPWRRTQQAGYVGCMRQVSVGYLYIFGRGTIGSLRNTSTMN